MAEYGVLIGTGLLIVVTAVSLLLGWKAAGSVARFREEHHERFDGRAMP